MNVRSAVAVAAVFGSVAAVGAWTTSRPAEKASTAQGMKWSTTLESMNGSKIKGTATLAAGSAAGTSVATVSITGGKANTTYPWHVHVGKCPTGTVFGPPSAYKPVAAGADGAGTSTANLTVAVPASGDYHLNIHASETDMKTIVACGNFTMAGM